MCRLGIGSLDEVRGPVAFHAQQAVRREAAGAMYASLCGIPAATHIHVVSAADVERYHDSIGTIVRPALSEGVLLCDRT